MKRGGYDESAGMHNWRVVTPLKEEGMANEHKKAQMEENSCRGKRIETLE